MDLLDYSGRVWLRSTRAFALMGLELIEGQFLLPAFVVEGNDQVVAGSSSRIQQGGQQPLPLTLAGAARIVEVYSMIGPASRHVAAPIALARAKFGQNRAIRQGLNQRKSDSS